MNNQYNFLSNGTALIKIIKEMPFSRHFRNLAPIL